MTVTVHPEMGHLYQISSPGLGNILRVRMRGRLRTAAFWTRHGVYIHRLIATMIVCTRSSHSWQGNHWADCGSIPLLLLLQLQSRWSHHQHYSRKPVAVSLFVTDPHKDLLQPLFPHLIPLSQSPTPIISSGITPDEQASETDSQKISG